MTAIPLQKIGSRLGRAVVIIAMIAIVNFFLLKIAPGDAVDVLAGETGSADAHYMEQLRKDFGLERPLYAQLITYVGNLLRLDLGYSFRYQQPVLNLILERLPATMMLVFFGVALAVVVGVLAGVAAARFRGRWVDHVLSVLILIAYATPLFWLGMMMTVYLSAHLGLLPSGGMQTPGVELSPLGTVLDLAKHLIMPTISLATFYVAIYARLVRSAMLDILRLDYVRTAIAKGVSERRIIYRHALRNAILPVVTVFGLQFGNALGGAVVIEVVFAWPGLGRLAYDALFQRDLNLLLGILFLSSVFVALVNVAVDFAYTRIDPRIRVRS